MFSVQDYEIREEVEKRLQLKKEEIILKKKRMIAKRKLKFSGASDFKAYKQLRQSFIYMIFIIVYVTVAMMQTNNGQMHVAGQFMKSYIEAREFVADDGFPSDIKAIEEYHDILQFIG
jgi:hypothetical protein